MVSSQSSSVHLHTSSHFVTLQNSHESTPAHKLLLKGKLINERSRKENSSNFRATFDLSSDLSVTHDRKHQNNIQQHIAFSVTPLRSHVTFAIRKFSESTCHIDHFVDAVSLLYLILRPLQKRLLCIFFLNSYLLLKYHTKLKS